MSFSRPRSKPAYSPAALLLLAVAAVLPLSCTSCTPNPATPGKPAGVPDPSDPKYREAVSAFFAGTIALATSDQSDRKTTLLKRAVELAPGEPAAWANLALTYTLVQGTMQNAMDEARKAITRARELAPENPDVTVAQGFIDQAAGKFPESLAEFQLAAKRDPNNLKVLWKLAEVADQNRAPDSDAVRADIFDKILKIRPDNVPTLLEAIRTAAAMSNAARTRELVARLGQRDATFSADARKQFAEIKAASDAGDWKTVRIGAAKMAHVLAPTAGYKSSLNEVKFRSDNIGEPIDRLLKMKNPSDTPAAPDTALTYAAEAIPDAAKTSLAFAQPPNEKDTPVVYTVSGEAVHIGGVAAPLALPAAAASQGAPAKLERRFFAAVDLENDYLTDLVYAGPGGLKVFRQKEDHTYADVTAATKLPPAVLSASYTGVYSVDIESDGDLDLILSAASGPPVVLQNNGDGTFTPIKTPFPEVACPIRAFAYGDIDGDGDADPVFADKDGKPVFYSNERSGLFRPRKGPEGMNGPVAALTMAEVTGDAVVDVVALLDDGQVVAISDRDNGLAWQAPQNLFKSGVTKGTAIFAADLDNNGGPDLVVAGAAKSEAYLSDPQGKFATPAIAIPVAAASVQDLNGDGLLDFVGVGADGKAARVLASGSKKYNWQNFSLVRSKQPAKEDERINSFCIGGEAEIRAGLLYGKQPITQPQVHFGLGENTQVDVARIIWPTGNAQSEFEQKSGIIAAEQRLGGSCPFLYTWDGSKMTFVTDCIWRSPIGLKINAQATAGTSQTTDWVKVRGDQLTPRNGFYDISITGELRETHYFDLVQLMVVDHPADTEIWVDERFVPTEKPRLEAIETGISRPIQKATGTNGQDVTETLRDRDNVYLDDFGRGQYQGVTRDHWVELSLEDAPRGVPLYLIASGWLHPTDSSINVAIGQNPSTPKPQGMTIETPDASGKWTAAKPGLGFPEGKVKTVVLRVDDTFKADAPRRVRLRTNLEIFWDRIAWAEAKPNAPKKTQTLTAAAATLRYRGFSVVKAANPSSPELPVSYEDRAGVAPMWRDLIGFHTRYGDILPLVTKVDDRYVMLNAGDELQVKFREAAPPPDGWKRDYIVIGDGWEKDGNINTTWGKTVMPYPAHDIKDYTVPPGALEDDPVYRRHPEDWQTYHTRYVTPDAFRDALLPSRRLK